MNKRSAMFLTFFFLIACGTAFAEDGVKVLLGYSIGSDSNKFSQADLTPLALQNGLGNGYIKSSPLIHGPSLDVRYEGTIFVRGTFNYNWMASDSQTAVYTGIQRSMPKYSGKGNEWEAEVDFGYKVLNQNNISLVPYVGVGYHDIKNTTNVNNDQGNGINSVSNEYSAPYVALGALATYAVPDTWSIGLDPALLLPFAGQIKNVQNGNVSSGGTNGSDNYKTGLGIGCKIQLPLTYTLMAKKDNSFGLLLFATPYYEYFYSGNSRTLKTSLTGPNGGDRMQTKSSENLYGGKVGIGFEF